MNELFIASGLRYGNAFPAIVIFAVTYPVVAFVYYHLQTLVFEENDVRTKTVYPFVYPLFSIFAGIYTIGLSHGGAYFWVVLIHLLASIPALAYMGVNHAVLPTRSFFAYGLAAIITHITLLFTGSPMIRLLGLYPNQF